MQIRLNDRGLFWGQIGEKYLSKILEKNTAAKANVIRKSLTDSDSMTGVCSEAKSKHRTGQKSGLNRSNFDEVKVAEELQEHEEKNYLKYETIWPQLYQLL